MIFEILYAAEGTYLLLGFATLMLDKEDYGLGE
jgi:hypothetical protein